MNCLLGMVFCLYILSIFILVQKLVNKRLQDVISEIGFGVDFDVFFCKCKIYYGYCDILVIGMQIEGGEWVFYYMIKGVFDISLQDCGIGEERLCEKVFWICISGKFVCEIIILEGKSRYEIIWL